jgi:hypothetical protein
VFGVIAAYAIDTMNGKLDIAVGNGDGADRCWRKQMIHSGILGIGARLILIRLIKT